MSLPITETSVIPTKDRKLPLAFSIFPFSYQLLFNLVHTFCAANRYVHFSTRKLKSKALL